MIKSSKLGRSHPILGYICHQLILTNQNSQETCKKNSLKESQIIKMKAKIKVRRTRKRRIKRNKNKIK
jgi:hypothetical protein